MTDLTPHAGERPATVESGRPRAESGGIATNHQRFRTVSAEELSFVDQVGRTLLGDASTPRPFWQQVDGERIAAAVWEADREAFWVQFVAGPAYSLPISSLSPEVRAEDVSMAEVDELGDGVIVWLDGGATTDFSADFVLYHCEPAYRAAVDAANPRPVEPRPERTGRRVRALRERRNLSLRQLAREIGMAPANLSKLETGKHEPRLDTLMRVARALGVSVAHLVGA